MPFGWRTPSPRARAWGLCFEDLTLCPYDRSLIELSLLRDDEKKGVDAYHEQVRAAHPPVPPDVAAWLAEAGTPSLRGTGPRAGAGHRGQGFLKARNGGCCQETCVLPWRSEDGPSGPEAALGTTCVPFFAVPLLACSGGSYNYDGQNLSQFCRSMATASGSTGSAPL